MKCIAESNRIYLRETDQNDADFFFRLNKNPEVLRFTGDPPFTSVQEARAFLSKYDHFQKYGMGRWAVVLKANEQILGWCGLKYHPKENFIDLGFRFFQDQWGKGYATESSLLSVRYGFEFLGLKSIIGRADSRNVASIRVLEKVGMTKIETVQENNVDIRIMKVDKSKFNLLFG